MKTKPFDLELAKLGHPLITKEGKKATQFQIFITEDDYSCCVVVENLIQAFTKKGLFYISKESFKDLLLDLSTPWEKPFVKGEMVEVKDKEPFSHERRKYVFSYKNLHYCESIHIDEHELVAWKYIRHIQSKDEIDISITVNGKEIDLKDISEETLLAIRNKQ